MSSNPLDIDHLTAIAREALEGFANPDYSVKESTANHVANRAVAATAKDDNAIAEASDFVRSLSDRILENLVH